VKGGHKQASGKFGAGAMEGFRRTNVFEAPLNAVLDRMRAVFGRMPGKNGHVRNVEPLHAELSDYESAQIAQQEWLWALAYFHEVSEPGLVDYAVYSLQAAERKYMYLLEKAREEYASMLIKRP